jgi:cystathionine beta-lyase
MEDLSLCVHHPAVSQEGFASLTVPTHRASTIVFEDVQSYVNRKHRGPDGYSYGLHGTPTTRTLEAQLTTLEQGERTVLVPSGQAAVTVVLMTVLRPGDKVLVPDTVYPPVKGFCLNYLKPRGIDYQIYDPMIGEDIAQQIDERTRLVWVESPGSTTMEFQDVPAIVRAAHARGALVGCDNTWATPLLFKPLAHGADFSAEALTKFVGGHSDLLMGSISVSDITLHRRLKDTMRMIGLGVSPDDVSLALRGIETMGVRLAHTGRIATLFAERMVNFPSVARVLHPALPSCPGHEIWKRDFAGVSSVFSVVLKPATEAMLETALSKLKIVSIGASWGGTHSLIAPMSVKADRIFKPGTEYGTILRVSVGLEDPEELWGELTQVLQTLGDAQGL